MHASPGEGCLREMGLKRNAGREERSGPNALLGLLLLLVHYYTTIHTIDYSTGCTTVEQRVQ